MKHIDMFNHAMSWIKKNTINGQGITITSRQRLIYPEVTGYYIPTLLDWGERNLAISYAKYLCSIQKPDGSWYDSDDKEPYVFDTAQILKGLLAVRDMLPAVDEHIIRGCNWLIGNIDEEGRLTTPSKNAWGNDEGFCSELCHIYCLTPLKEAGKVFDKTIYVDKAKAVLEFYKKNYYEKIMNFSLMSHFYAYVMEGLLDLGEEEMVREAMQKLKRVQNAEGGIPALYNVKWVCSTGMFQLALVWYKLGELKEGDKIFKYACRLQNKSGGWFGSYPAPSSDRFAKGKQEASYFPKEEISWANKYFLDALCYKMRLEFEGLSTLFSDTILKSDGRYQLIMSEMADLQEAEGSVLEVCDIGCGKGRYLKNLLKDFPENHYHGVDLSVKVMENLEKEIDKKQGSLTSVPYQDATFDYVYVVEALEHAVYIQGALNELWRITKPQGKIVIIDKPVEALGKLQIEEWEQWIAKKQLAKFVSDKPGKMRVIKNIAYENDRKDGLFNAWIIEKQQ